MAEYRLTADPTVVVRESDGVLVPVGQPTADSLAYALWLSGGQKAADGTLLPAGVPDPAMTLTQAQAAQLAALSASCQAAITAGFSSSALGTANAYTLSITDQTNLLSAYTAAQAAQANAKGWAAAAAVPLYEVVLAGSAYYLCLQAGTTGAAAPAWPAAMQQVVTDGTVQWALAGWLLSTAAGSQWHTPAQVIAVWQAYLAFVNGCRATYAALAAQVNAATTVAAVQAVVW